MEDRRVFVRRLIGVVAVGTAGCLGERPETVVGPGETPTRSPTATATSTGTATATPEATATPSGQVVDVAVGPEGRLRFDPETVEIGMGDTVRWTFESAGHNVTTLDGASEKVSIPEGAEPFASYEGDQHFAINEVGTTYEHTFTVPGEYVYVCAPHEDQGMVAAVVVTE